MTALGVCVIDGIVVEEDIVFTLDELCHAAGAGPAQVLRLVDEGVLQPIGDAPDRWAFPGPSLRITRAALRLTTDLALSPDGAALVLELLDEIQALRSRMRRAGMA